MAEKLLKSSQLEYAIFRPSVLTGNSLTGAVRNFSGYYSLVKALVSAVEESRKKSERLRFPYLPGASNIVPVNIAARFMGDLVLQNARGTSYITNQNPPKAQWVLEKTLKYFGISDIVENVHLDFDVFGSLELSKSERSLYDYCRHFQPYLFMNYSFPKSDISEIPIDEKYIHTILSFAQKAGYFQYGQ